MNWTLYAPTLSLALLAACASYAPKPLKSEPDLVRPDQIDGAALLVELQALPEIKHTTVRIDPTDGLGPDEAALIALVLNPDLRSARVRRGVASVELLRAGLLPEPTLGLALDVPTGGATDGTVTGMGLGLDWALGELRGRDVRRRAARLDASAVDLEILWQEFTLAAHVRGLVSSLAAARAALALVDQQLEGLRVDVASLSTALADGWSTAPELAVEQANLDAELGVRLAIAEVADKLAIELAALLGLTPGLNIEVRVEERALETAAETFLITAGTRWQGFAERRADLIALRLAYDSQEARVQNAALERFPKLSLGPVFGQDTGNLWSFGLGFSFDLPVFGHAAVEQQSQTAIREVLFAEYTARLQSAQVEYASVHNEVQARLAQLKQLDLSVRHQAELVQRLNEGQARGLVPRLEARHAEREWIALRIQALEVRAELQAALELVDVLAGQYEPIQTVTTPLQVTES